MAINTSQHLSDRQISYTGPTEDALSVYDAVGRFLEGKDYGPSPIPKKTNAASQGAVYDAGREGEVILIRSRKGFPQGRPRAGNTSVHVTLLMNSSGGTPGTRLADRALRKRSDELVAAVEEATGETLE